MATSSLAQTSTQRYSAVKYIAPFVLFLAVLGLFGYLPLEPGWTAPLWFVIFVPVCAICWPREISLRPRHWMASTAVGAGVFVLWVAPEILIGGYRSLPPFSNSLIGHIHSSMPAAALHSSWVLAWRTARAVMIVPIVEELFWRGWLMRWLINTDFERVPLGMYAPFAFWVTALMFGSEHGPYWDVGLIAGVIYNLWMIRSKSLADCILMHAVTNAMLSVYVIGGQHWQYWQ